MNLRKNKKMQTTNIIYIDKNTWSALRNAKVAIKLFKETNNVLGEEKYTYIYKSTLSSLYAA